MIKHTPSFSTHLEEYVFASNYIYKKDVLDLGGYWGYGSHILSYGAESIDLLDFDEDALYKAKERFKFFSAFLFPVMNSNEEHEEITINLTSQVDMVFLLVIIGKKSMCRVNGLLWDENRH